MPRGQPQIEITLDAGCRMNPIIVLAIEKTSGVEKKVSIATETAHLLPELSSKLRSKMPIVPAPVIGDADNALPTVPAPSRTRNPFRKFRFFKQKAGSNEYEDPIRWQWWWRRKRR